MGKVLIWVSCVFFVFSLMSAGGCGLTIYFGCQVPFEIGCSGHLKRAADANTVELAAQELDSAITYLEAKKCTAGSTHVLWATPATDVEFWYKNLVSSREELAKIHKDVPQLERTNVLMKLRETLMDENHITVPYEMERYPHNFSFFLWAFVNWVVGIVSCLVFFTGVTLYEHNY